MLFIKHIFCPGDIPVVLHSPQFQVSHFTLGTTYSMCSIKNVFLLPLFPSPFTFLFLFLATFLRCPCTGSTCPSCVAHLDVGPSSARPWTPAHLTLPVGPAHKPCPSLNGGLTWHLVIECPRPMPTSSTTTTTTTTSTSAHAVQCQCICPRQQWPRAVCPTSYCLTAWLEQWNVSLITCLLFHFNIYIHDRILPHPQTPPSTCKRHVLFLLIFLSILSISIELHFVITVYCPSRESMAAHYQVVGSWCLVTQLLFFLAVMFSFTIKVVESRCLFFALSAVALLAPLPPSPSSPSIPFPTVFSITVHNLWGSAGSCLEAESPPPHSIIRYCCVYFIVLYPLC